MSRSNAITPPARYSSVMERLPQFPAQVDETQAAGNEEETARQHQRIHGILRHRVWLQAAIGIELDGPLPLPIETPFVEPDRPHEQADVGMEVVVQADTTPTDGVMPGGEVGGQG